MKKEIAIRFNTLLKEKFPNLDFDLLIIDNSNVFYLSIVEKKILNLKT